MLKRAWIWLGIAIVPALLGFSGILEVTEAFFQVLCYVCIGFALLSLLLSLFDEVGEPLTWQDSLEPRIISIHGLKSPATLLADLVSSETDVGATRKAA